MAEEHRDVFLSCFKCGRIVRASDDECPRCGLQFGPGTLFECPFCSGLVWRNATKCSTCGIDLTEFSESVEKTYAGFDMDEFVENIINTELEQIKSMVRRVACPGCGLMIRGDEVNCPRCDLPLAEAKVECPVCSEKMSISAKSCPNCHAIFKDAEPEQVEEEPKLSAEELELLGAMVRPDTGLPSETGMGQDIADVESEELEEVPAEAPKPTRPVVAKKKRVKTPAKEDPVKAPQSPPKSPKKPARKASPKKAPKKAPKKKASPKKSPKAGKPAKAKKKR